VVVIAFITATTYFQLAVAILLYPMLILFAYNILPKNTFGTSQKPLKKLANTFQITKPSEGVKTEKIESVGISDIDKRVFLKLIGGTGIFLFLFSIFNKRAEDLLFKNFPGSGKFSTEYIAGKDLDPTENQPLDGYKISEIDDSVISFYGFTNKDGVWYVLRVDTENGSFRYAKGDTNFSDNWSNRENLKYDYFHKIFSN